MIAFYDFRKKTMVVVNGALEREFPGQPPELQIKLDDMILAHEFTHALQDQNFDFGAKDLGAQEQWRPRLALHSVAKGDATIAGYACMLGRMDPAILATLIGNLKSFSQTFTGAAAGVPRGVAEPLIFQYTEGVEIRCGGLSARRLESRRQNLQMIPRSPRNRSSIRRSTSIVLRFRRRSPSAAACRSFPGGIRPMKIPR